MRMLMVGAALVMMTSAAMISSVMADDDDAKGAQKLATQGRDDYWHCLAREYSRVGNQGLSEQGFWPLRRRSLSVGATILPGGTARLSHRAISGY
ncbi:hypothetical protein ACVWZL_004448 [Bradyrhizobium sp. GM2.4]